MKPLQFQNPSGIIWRAAWYWLGEKFQVRNISRRQLGEINMLGPCIKKFKMKAIICS